MVVKKGETTKWLKMLGITSARETGRAVDEKGESEYISVEREAGMIQEIYPLPNQFCVSAVRQPREGTSSFVEDVLEVPLVGEEIPKWKVTLLIPSINERLEPTLVEVLSMEGLDDDRLYKFVQLVKTFPQPQQCLANLKERINSFFEEE